MRCLPLSCFSLVRTGSALLLLGVLSAAGQAAPAAAPAAAPSPEELATINTALKTLLSNSDAGAKSVLDKYPTFNPITPGFGGARGAAGGAAAAGGGGRGGRGPAIPLTDDIRAELKTSMNNLAGQIDDLKKKYAGQKLYDRVADVEIYLDAVKYTMEDAGTPNPYTRTAQGTTTPFSDINVAQARTALSAGLERAGQLAQGQTPWMLIDSVRGYYSKIDGSAQPYKLNIPVGYNPADNKKFRLDIFEHGRGQAATEMGFINGGLINFNQIPSTPDATRFILQPWGRWCNATRFAGEIDSLEAIDSVKRAYSIDENRIVMTGFSMGGASGWLYATHYPDLWAATSAGAGFTETTVFLNLRTLPPTYQQTLWHMYDSVDYAANLFNDHMVAYAGTIDPQRQASEAMKAAMSAVGLEMERVDGPNVGHTYEPGARLQLMARLDELAAKGRDPSPLEVHFTTWMLRYNKSFWVSLDGMDKQWDRAEAHAKVDGNNINATTTNISAMHLSWEAGLAPFAVGAKPTLTIDGAALTLPAVAADKSLKVGLIKTNGKWQIGDLPASQLHKSPGLQGPIDDAFMDSFMVVRPTGTAFNATEGKWTTAECDRAIHDWRESFRGEARVKNDTEITDADIANNNLILFGDPSSNAILKRIADKLPIKWTVQTVTVGDKTYPSTYAAPIMIYPNPLNPAKYIVINSGFTFHDLDNNDKMNPKLPDWAVVDFTQTGDINLPTAAVGPVGFFDESWKLASQAN